MALSLAACKPTTPGKPDDGDIVIEDNDYTGTLVVDQNDGTYYTQQEVNVRITFDTDDNGGILAAEIKMFQVSFAEKMPMKLDMTIPGVTASATNDGITLSGDNIIPLAMGGEFPAYTITGITGEVTANAVSFGFKCGQYPLTFTGAVKK